MRAQRRRPTSSRGPPPPPPSSFGVRYYGSPNLPARGSGPGPKTGSAETALVRGLYASSLSAGQLPPTSTRLVRVTSTPAIAMVTMLKVLVCLAGAGLITAPATAEGQRAAGASGGRERLAPPAIEVNAGFTESSLFGGRGAAATLGAQFGLPVPHRRRVVAAVDYARELSSTEGCCDPEATLSYRQEALVLGLGIESTVGGDKSSRISIDGRFQPTLHHTVRRGTRPGFPLSDTEWHLALGHFSVGVSGRRSIGNSFQASVGARVNLKVSNFLVDAPPRTGLVISLGLGR